jgi:hypothetical protein
LGLLRNPWQEYGAVERSSGAIVAVLKELPLTASEFDVGKRSPADLNIPPVSSPRLWVKMIFVKGDFKA